MGVGDRKIFWRRNASIPGGQKVSLGPTLNLNLITFAITLFSNKDTFLLKDKVMGKESIRRLKVSYIYSSCYQVRTIDFYQEVLQMVIEKE